MVSMVARRPPPTVLSAAAGPTQGRPPPHHLRRRKYAARGLSRAPRLSRLFLHFQRIFDGVERRKLHIVKLAVDLLDLADIDVLDDLSRLRINGNRPTRTLPFHSLHRGDQVLAVGLALR